jgi:outer membrane immunogenic protein
LARCDRIATTIEFNVYLPTSGFFSGPYPAILVELGGLLMRRLSATFIAAVSTVAFTQLAAAADLPRKAPIYTPPPVYSWTGFYIGANIGGGWGGRSVGYTPNDPEADALFRFGGAPPRASFTSSGVVGGIQAGYNWQFSSRWLVGFETDFDWSGIKGSGSTSGVYAPYFSAPFNAPVEERIEWFGTVRARLGYLPMDDLLLYATGGFAYGRLKQSGSWITSNGFAASGGGFDILCTTNVTCFAGSSSHIATGWVAGGGLEYSLWQKWSLKAEYLYVSLDSKSVTESSVAFSPGDLPASFKANFSRANFNVARVGLNYRF